MKTKFTSIAFVLSLFLISCGSSNDDSNSTSNSRWTEEEKGSSNDNSNWSQAEKDAFKDNCMLGANESYCDCMLGVVMTKYATPIEAAAVMDMSVSEIMELAMPCL